MSQPTSSADNAIDFGLPFGADQGAGDPVLGAGDYLPFSSSGFFVSMLQNNLSQRPSGQGDWVGEEGGYILRVVSPTAAFEHFPYRVKLMDANNQGWPIDEAGCHGTLVGMAHNCYPKFANTVLDFASPQVPTGLYTVQVIDSRGIEYLLPLEIQAVPTPWSREVMTTRSRMPGPVYNPYPDTGAS